jgi:transposase-like protein
MEFERDYPDDAACLEKLAEWLYPDGVFCPKCEKITKHHRAKSRPSYCCQFCGHHEHPMRVTIFQDSATSLKLWFYAIYLMSETRCGISAKQLERELGVTYKTAWRMFKQIRSMLDESDDGPKLSGKIEMDESFYGALEKKTSTRVSASTWALAESARLQSSAWLSSRAGSSPKSYPTGKPRRSCAT